MTVVVVVPQGRDYIRISQVLATSWNNSHVEVYVQPPPEVVADTVIHQIQDDGSRYSFTPDYREIRLPLTTQAYRELRLVTA
jgi:hypothetical protein